MKLKYPYLLSANYRLHAVNHAKVHLVFKPSTIKTTKQPWVTTRSGEIYPRPKQIFKTTGYVGSMCGRTFSGHDNYFGFKLVPRLEPFLNEPFEVLCRICFPQAPYRGPRGKIP